MLEYVSARSRKSVWRPIDRVVIGFYGPRGGSRACEELLPDAALQLASDLVAAVADLRTRAEKLAPCA